MFGKIASFFGKEKYSKIEKIIKGIIKITDKTRKNLADIFEEDKKFLTNITKLINYYEIRYSKYNTDWIDELITKIKFDNINDEFKKNIIIKLNQYKNHIKKEIQSLITNIQQFNLSFAEKPKNNNDKKTIFIDELEEIVNDKNTDDKIINSLFLEITKKAYLDQSYKNINLKNLFIKLIKHPKLNRKNLLDFLLSTSMEGLNNDMNTYELKKIIIREKIIITNDIVKMSKLEYIGLWKEILDTYILGNYILPDFLEAICDVNKEFNMGRYSFVIQYYEENKNNLTEQAKTIIKKYLKNRDEDLKIQKQIIELKINNILSKKDIFKNNDHVIFLTDILYKKDLDKKILENIWNILLENIEEINNENNENYKKILENLIKHPNKPEKKIQTFLKSIGRGDFSKYRKYPGDKLINLEGLIKNCGIF